jgi:O-antigen/teichoic acid export membrane protein
LKTLSHDASANVTVRSDRWLFYRRLLTNADVRQNVFLLAANVLAGLCIYLTHSVLGHLLGPSAYGTIAALLALASLLLIPTHVISTVTTKYVAALSEREDIPKLNDLIRRLTAILLPVGIAAMVVFMAASGFISTFLRIGTPREVVVLGLMFAVSFVAPLNVGAMLGQQRFSWFAIFLVLPVLLRLVLAVAFALLGFGVLGAIAGIAAADILTYIASFQPMRGLLRGPRLSFGSLRLLWSYSMMAMAVFAITSVLTSADTLFAKHFLSIQEAGLYASIATAGKIVSFVSNSVVVAMFPKFAASHSRGERPTRAVFLTAASTCALCGVVEAIFIICPTLVMRAMFGPTFVVIAGQLPWYGAAALIATVAGVFTNFFLSIGHRHVVMPLVSGFVIESALFVVRHRSIGELVQNLMLANCVMLVALLALFIGYSCRRRPA